MGKKTKLAKSRLDKYYHLAKEQGYRSRASFKLIEINKKHNFLGSARCVVDLCAAPGGWLQVCTKFMPVSSILIGVDLVPIKGIHGAITLCEDITTQRCLTAINKEMNKWKADAVLHDGAPNVGGAWDKDSYSQVSLALSSLKLATKLLRKGGTFVTKIFRSRDYDSFLFVCRQMFRDVSSHKPFSSRATSAEIFIVCKGYNWKTQDPRLLDPNFVFRNTDEASATVNVLSRGVKHKRNREGYAVDAPMVLTKSASVVDFIQDAKPQEFLANYNSLKFDKQSAMVRDAKETTDEIRALCDDLMVLNKGDFRALLKWRSAVRPLLVQEADSDDEDDSDEEGSGSDDVDGEDEKLSREDEDALRKKREEAILARMERQTKKRKKKIHERKMLAKQRMAGAGFAGEGIDADEHSLFSLAQLPDEGDAREEVIEPNLDEELLDDDAMLASDDEDAAKADDDNSDEDDSDAEDYLEAQEKQFDRMYERFKARRGILQKRRKLSTKEADSDSDDEKAKIAAFEDSDNGGGDGEAPGADADSAKAKANTKVKTKKSEKKEKSENATAHEWSDIEEEDANGKALLPQDVEDRFFSRGIFGDIESRLTSLPSPTADSQKSQTNSRKRTREERDSDSSDGDDSEEEDDVGASSDVEVEASEDSDAADSGDEADSETENEEMEVEAEADDSNSNSSSREEKKQKPQKETVRSPQKSGKAGDKKGEEDPTSDSDDDDEHVPYAKRKSSARTRGRQRRLEYERTKVLEKNDRGGANAPVAAGLPASDADHKAVAAHHHSKALAAARAATGGSFEEVALEVDDDYSSDSDADAEGLAIGKAMLKKRRREEIINSAYNRYSFNDAEYAPEWFVDQEREHMRPQLPVTREEIEAERERLKSIDARPIKKVAEARLRKKLKTMKRMEKMKHEAEAITSNTDMSSKQKIMALERLRGKGMKTKKKAVHYVVNTKGGARSKVNRPKGARLKLVDQRMKSDLRGRRASEKKSDRQAKKKAGRRRKGGGNSSRGSGNASKKRQRKRR